LEDPIDKCGNFKRQFVLIDEENRTPEWVQIGRNSFTIFADIDIIVQAIQVINPATEVVYLPSEPEIVYVE